WKDGQAYDLTSLLGSSDWQLYSATGIDDDGTIVGFGSYKGEYAAFRMTPQAVPEPASMLALGLGAVALLRRRAR
ncbi:PEP-CTERM sorting domain-containing protein, partial [bacterium]